MRFAAAFAFLLAATFGWAQDGKAPIRVAVSIPKNQADKKSATVELDGNKLPAQLLPASVSTKAKAKDGEVLRDLCFLAPASYDGKAEPKIVSFSAAPDRTGPSFVWKNGDDHDDLYLGDRPVMRYMHRPYDTSSADARNKSYKVFHHLWDPAGKRFVTNGGQTNENAADAKKLLFPHHRGLMFGFNRVSYGEKKTADTWHCTGDAHVSHVKTLDQEAGPIVARHVVLLTWHGPKNEIFAEEEREMTVWNVGEGTVVDFATRLKSKVGKVRLDGDPQHAGFQFRAHNDVAEKTAKQTYYLRPDGKDAPGKTRNWPGDKTHVNLPWDVVSFVLDDQRYSVAYIDSPTNPGEKRHSERDYARFGCYFEYDLTEERPLTLNHRVWLVKGELTKDQVEHQRGWFVGSAR
jgi:hypothetical protein